MAKKKNNNNHTISLPIHPAILYLNWAINANLKQVLGDVHRDVFEDLAEIHESGKPNRSHHLYLTTEEVYNYIVRYNPSVIREHGEAQIRNVALLVNIAVSWKQLQQVFAFDSRLLDDIFDIDLKKDKNYALDMDAVEHLPCFNFFVEYPITIHNIKNNTNTYYDGFFLFFSPYHSVEHHELIHIMFIHNGGEVLPAAKCRDRVDFFTARLVYKDVYGVLIDEDGSETILDNLKSSEFMKAANPIVFEQLGDEAAYSFLAKLNNLVAYLCTSNADFKRERANKKKPDSKRTHFSDAEYEKWSLGKTTYDFLYEGRHVPANYLNVGPTGAYERLVQVESPNAGEYIETDEIDDTGKPHASGYHVRPHMRRGHYKTYWYGKKDGSEERHSELKWIPSMWINNTGEDIVIPTRSEYTYLGFDGRPREVTYFIKE